MNIYAKTSYKDHFQSIYTVYENGKPILKSNCAICGCPNNNQFYIYEGYFKKHQQFFNSGITMDDDNDSDCMDIEDEPILYIVHCCNICKGDYNIIFIDLGLFIKYNVYISNQ